jgi:salicylate 5-hydroxylase small subunit
MTSLELQRRVEDFYAAYVETLDDGDIEKWPDFFTEHAVYKAIPRENYDRNLPLATMRYESRAMLRDRVVTIQKTILHAPRYLRHMLSNVRVHGETDGKLLVRANYVVFQTLVEQPTTVFSAGRYVDTLEAAGDSFLFAEKLCVFDTELVPNSLIYPL